MSTRFFTNHGAQTLFAKFQDVFASNKDLAAFDALVGFALHQLHTGRLNLIFNRITGADRAPFDTTPFRYKEIGEAADIPAQIRGDLEAILSEAAEGRI